MCNSEFAAAAGGLNVGLDVLGFKQQEEAAERNEELANQNAAQAQLSLQRREQQETEAAAAAIARATRESRAAQGQVQTSLGAAGVQGGVAAELIGEFQRQEEEFQTTRIRELRFTQEQLVDQRRAVEFRRAAQIGQVRPPTLFELGLQIAQTGVNTLGQAQGAQQQTEQQA